MRRRNIRTGSISDTTVQAGTKFPRVRLEQRAMQYLYAEDNNYYFMDQENYEQIGFSAQQLGDTVNYLKDGMIITVSFYEQEPVDVEPPINVELQIVETDPGFRGDTASGGTKPAKTGDRPGGAGAAVREPGRDDPRGHPHRSVPRTGLARSTVLDRPAERGVWHRAGWKRGR